MNRTFNALIALSCSTYGYCQYAPVNQGLDSELKRLGTSTVLILKSNAIDEYPLWSKTGDFLALNVEGKWIKIELGIVKLEAAKWRGGQPLGINVAKGSVALADDAEIKEWEELTKMYPREITLPNGTKIELKEAEMSVSLIITKKSAKPETIWTTGGENCYGLTASPDGRFVAFISELNGAVIMKVAD
jgi:hypothetical protein